MNMKYAFFEPFVGDYYHKGINGKKVLVLGASFYCPKKNCEFYAKCTDTNLKDSSTYDEICPEYKKKGICLHDEPKNSIGNEYQTYSTFVKGISQFTGCEDYDTIWGQLAFTNYVQFFLPGNGEEFRPTNTSDMSERDFGAFLEVVKKIQPDIIIIWGCVINSRLKEQNEYVIDKENLPKNEWYLCHMRIPHVDHDIVLVNPNHPSSSAWHSDKEKFLHYLEVALNE